MVGGGEYILYALMGIGLGTITGLIPGIHVNTLIPFFYLLNPSLVTCVMIVALMMTHTFLNFIPSTLLGVPDETTALSVLPAHRMLLEGRGLEAIKLTALGSMGSMLVAFLILYPVYLLMPVLYKTISPYMGYFLVGISGVLIFTEDGIKRLYALLVYLLSGILGYLVLNGHFLPEDQKLFPVFTGLFGLSLLLFSVKNDSSIPIQPIDFRLLIPKKEILKNICKGSLAGMFVAFFPGLGNAQATVLVQMGKVKKKLYGSRGFIIACSGVNTSNALFSLLALYTIQKPRSGAVIAIQHIIDLGKNELLLFLAVVLFSSGIAVVLTLQMGRGMVYLVQKLPYTQLSVVIVAFLTVAVVALTGLAGLIVLVTALCIGVLPHLFGVKKSHCMGVILFPVILYYLL